MKKFDPSIIFVLFGVIVAASVLRIPLLFVFFIVYVVWRMNSNARRQRGERTDRERSRDYGRSRRRYQRDYQRERTPKRERPIRKRPVTPRSNPFKKSGITKFKDYDYEGAIEDFAKALEINPNDVAVHFNLACAYSLMENVNKSIYHLDLAVRNGFKDFEKIKTHDALAFLRIQKEFETFENNNYRWEQKTKTNQPTPTPKENKDLLAQLEKLAELRDKGLLSEAEYVSQKKKLLD